MIGCVNLRVDSLKKESLRATLQKNGKNRDSCDSDSRSRHNPNSNSPNSKVNKPMLKIEVDLLKVLENSSLIPSEVFQEGLVREGDGPERDLRGCPSSTR